MKREWLLLVAAAAVSLLLGLGLIRWLAPELLGGPARVRLVRASESLPPFFEAVFETPEMAEGSRLLSDPYTIYRGVPLFSELLVPGHGPTDLLGFRNRAVPNVADVVALGDSQTYGNNALHAESWPARLEALLAAKSAGVYSMAVGGWGAVQYLDLTPKALRLRPRCLVVAFYTGNDPLDSFQVAYGLERWRELIPDPTLSAGDAPPVVFPPPEEEHFAVEFADGGSTVFTPTLRLASNQDHPAVRAGWEILAAAARRIQGLATAAEATPVFTILPTKELVYAPRVREERIAVPEDYARLVAAEERNLAELAAQLAALPRAVYVDALGPLRAALDGAAPIYGSGSDGHPLAAGYEAIARAMAIAVEPLLPEPPRGLVRATVRGEEVQYFLARATGIEPFASAAVAARNGWDVEAARAVEPRDLAALPLRPAIYDVDPDRFGPPSLSGPP